MNKPKIYATGNENLNGDFNISYYIVEKDSSFLDWLEKLLNDIMKTDGETYSVKFIVKNKKDKHGKFIGEEVFAKNIHKMVDLHEHYGSKEDRVDLFYGRERIYMTFRKSKETRRKFARFLSKTKDWIEIKEIPQLPVYAGRKIK
jgi:hypothetical protein